MKTKIFLISLVFVLFQSGCSFFSRSELPKLGQIPNFKFLNQKNESVTGDSLKGKAWIANFIFTSCAGTCPLLTEQMKKVQQALQQEVKKDPKILEKLHIISFSVDPERDTPERLSAYVQQYGVDSTLWSFLTGPLEEVQETVVNGFKTSMAKVALEESPEAKKTQEMIDNFDVVHSEKFVLIDSDLNIRGYYDADSQGLRKLVGDLKFLAGI